MQGILQWRKRDIVAVCGKNILCKVVCSDTEELGLVCKLLCQKRGGRHLDHHAYLHGPEVRPLVSLELRVCVLEQKQGRLHVLHP